MKENNIEQLEKQIKDLQMQIDSFKDLILTKDNQLQVIQHQNETHFINLEYELQKTKKECQLLEEDRRRHNEKNTGVERSNEKN